MRRWILLVEGFADEMFFNGLSNKVEGSHWQCHHIKIVPANGPSRVRVSDTESSGQK